MLLEHGSSLLNSLNRHGRRATVVLQHKLIRRWPFFENGIANRIYDWLRRIIVDQSKTLCFSDPDFPPVMPGH